MVQREFQHHVADIAAQTCKRHEVHVVTWPNGDRGTAIHRASRPPFYPLDGTASADTPYADARSPELERAYRRKIEEIKPDVVHLHQLFGLSAELVRISSEAGAVAVVTLHDYFCICPTDTIDCAGRTGSSPGPKCYSCINPNPYSRKRRLGYWMITNALSMWIGRCLLPRTQFGQRYASLVTRKTKFFDALRRSDAIISPSKTVARIYEHAGLDLGTIRIITHGTKPGSLTARSYQTGEPLRFGFIGNNRAKGLLLLLQAFRMVSRPKTANSWSGPISVAILRICERDSGGWQTSRILRCGRATRLPRPIQCLHPLMSLWLLRFGLSLSGWLPRRPWPAESRLLRRIPAALRR